MARIDVRSGSTAATDQVQAEDDRLEEASTPKRTSSSASEIDAGPRILVYSDGPRFSLATARTTTILIAAERLG